MKMLKIALGVLGALLIPAAVMATVLWTSTNGDINFPGLTPTTIDNMAVGQTTPAAGKFTTLEAATFIPGGNAGTTCATATPATATDAVFFLATRSFLVVSVSEVHSVAAGGASALQVVKDTGTTAPGAGTDLLTNNTNTGFDLNGTANTVQVGTLVALAATKTLAAGDRLSYDFAQAIQSSAGVVVTVCLQPL